MISGICRAMRRFVLLMGELDKGYVLRIREPALRVVSVGSWFWDGG